jgi:DNA-binding CsgD family transcriptional regulator
MLDEVRRTCADDQFLLMNVGAVLARIYLAIGSPQRALRALEEHLGQEATPGMEAEYNAWWGLVLACMGKGDDAETHASAAVAASRRTEVAGLVPWISAMSNIRISATGARTSILDAYQLSRLTGNVDGFVTAYRASREILEIVAEESRHHRDLRLILSRAGDQAFGRALGFHVPGTSGADPDLSRREEEVLALLVQGATNRELARALFISEATVKVHLRHIYAKLGVRTRTEAVVQALERGKTA